MKRSDIKYIIIIAFLLGFLCADYSAALKIPDVDLVGVTPELKEVIEDFIIPILNRGKYQLKSESSTVTSSTVLPTLVLGFDDSSVTKRLVISNGTNNYKVDLGQL